ncbi:zinc-binding dehydrogenase [Streptomyces sp. FXJ1.4098]|nr:zinc-binding dehydrogenase [Streptomyces sp. FXJ1.4098]
MRLRLVRRGHGRGRGERRRRTDRPARRGTGPAGLRCDDRPRRRPQHRVRPARVECGRHRLRWRRPVRHPGGAYRRGVHHHRRRPVGRAPGSEPAGGATHAVDPADGDPVEQVRALTDGRGADHSFEAVGLPPLLVQAFDMARMEGTVTYIGMPPQRDATLTLPAVSAIFTGKRIQGSVVGGSQILRDFPRYIRLAETGRLDLGAMVSRRITLDEVNEGIGLLERGEGVRTVIV